MQKESGFGSAGVLVGLAVVIGLVVLLLWMQGSTEAPTVSEEQNPVAGETEETEPMVESEGEVDTDTTLEAGADVDMEVDAGTEGEVGSESSVEAEGVADVVSEATSDAMSPGTYIAVKGESLALPEANEKTVLFFHADWCPSCRSADSDITANQGDIPAGLTVQKVDYDSETELRQKFGVTTQHTFVEIDGEGELVKKWSGSATLDDILAQVS